jgi:hypothetical protein
LEWFVAPIYFEHFCYALRNPTAFLRLGWQDQLRCQPVGWEEKGRDSYSTGVWESGDVGISAPGLLARLVGVAVQLHNASEGKEGAATRLESGNLKSGNAVGFWLAPFESSSAVQPLTRLSSF